MKRLCCVGVDAGIGVAMRVGYIAKEKEKGGRIRQAGRWEVGFYLLSVLLGITIHPLIHSTLSLLHPNTPKIPRVYYVLF